MEVYKKSYLKFKMACIILAGMIVTGCQSSVDLRVSPVLARKNATPVYIASILDLSKAKDILPKGRTRSDLIKEVLTDALHKKGYEVVTKSTRGGIPLDLKINRLSIRKERKSKRVYHFWRNRSETIEYFITVFDMSVLVTGDVFHDLKYALFESEVTLRRRESRYDFSNRGLNQFRAKLIKKIK